jgi:hypothetical protein
MPKIIHAISGPRNVSTAIMYSFAQRPGCTVFDEPLYGIYLKDTGVHHPGKEEVLKKWPTSIDKVEKKVASLNYSSEIYLKNMAHHQEKLPLDWVKPSAYIFWIRHPRKVIHSFTKVVDAITPMDVGLIQQWEQWEQLECFNGPKIIVDSDEMLENPRNNLPQICEALNLDWTENMLYWTAGRKNYDGPWWPYWYENVHKSEGFGRPKPMPGELRNEHEDVVQSTLTIYEQLATNRLKFK